MILPVLNGMKHVDTLTARFGDGAVVGCVCKVATVVNHRCIGATQAELQDLAYGEMDGSVSPA